jgi:vacuolar protein sorting-associated protein 13D
MSAPQSSVVSNYDNEEQPGRELDVEVSLAVSKGIGISVINSFPEELMFATLSGVCVDVSLNSSAQKVTLEVEHVQVDNQLVNTNFPILVYPTPNEEEETEDTLPVISASVEHVRHHLPGTTVLKHFNAHVCDLMVLMEERLLFRLIQWIQEGLASTDENMEDNAGKEAFSMLTRRTTATIVGGGGQLHFESIDLMMGVVRLSLHTTSNLPPDLRAIKHSLGVPTVTFEAPVVFDRYSQHHLSGTTQVVLESIATHYKRVVKDQSIKIAGSVDILGNPTGLMSDIASGVSGMFSQNPDILGFVRDVSHGIFDSTSKITGSASYILGQASFDSSYQDEREQMSNTCQTSSDHLSAGLIGLSSGIFGGLTSMVTQPYYGMVNEGIGGFFAGLGKGVAGTITKPVAGLFDFASNTSAALRETTSRISKVRPERLRPKRCCVDPSGALVPYQPQMARAQLYLRILKEQADDEMLVAYEHISNDGTRALISSNFVYFFKQTPPSPTDVEAKIDLELLHHCRDTISKGDKGDRAPIIVLSVQLSQELMQTKTFKFRCKSESLARNVSRLINYAKTVHEYRKTVVQTFRLQVQNIW